MKNVGPLRVAFFRVREVWTRAILGTRVVFSVRRLLPSRRVVPASLCASCRSMSRILASLSAVARKRLYTFSAPCARRASAVFVLFFSSVLVASTAFVSGARAAEEWNEFLSALKARGYDDVALVYLKQLQEKGEIPPELDAELDYKIGAAAFEAWATANGSAREPLAAEARAAFEKYLEASPDGASVANANMALARIATAEGDRVYAEATRKGAAEDTKNNKLLEARNAYSAAKPYLDAATSAFKEQVAELRANTGVRVEKLQQAQGAYLDALVRSATLQAQTARTFPRDSAEFKDGLTKARDNFGAIASSYGQFAGAFQARFYEAEIARDLGEVDEALSKLDELSALPYEDRFISLKTRALLLYGEIVDEKNEPDSNMSLVVKYNEWRENRNVPEDYYHSAEGLRITLLAGRAIVRLEKTRRADYDAFKRAGQRTFVDRTDPLFKTMDVPKNRESRGNTIVVFALRTLSELANGSGATAIEAQALLKDEIFDGVDLSKYSFAKKIDDFPSASAAAQRDASAFSQARQDYALAAPEVAAEAKKKMNEAGQKAIQSFRVAFDWGARAVRPDKRGRLRTDDLRKAQEELDSLYLKYALACYALERYEDAFVACEYLTIRRPDFANASESAVLALRSLQAISLRMRADEVEQETIDSFQVKLNDLAQRIAERWSDNPNVAFEASFVQLDSAVATRDLDSAFALLEKIPESSSRRANAELRLGQTLWKEWSARNVARLNAIREGDELDEESDGAERAKQDELLKATNKCLLDGLERLLNSSAGVTEKDQLAIFSTYLLALTYDKLGDVENVEKWLTHPVIGARVIVERSLKLETSDESETTEEEIPEFVNTDFQLAVLALALGTMIADPNRLEEAEKLATSLDALADGSEIAESKLTGVYLQLGMRLNERVVELKDAIYAAENEEDAKAKEEELGAILKGFESFLKRASEREVGVNYSSLRWIADSYLALGSGLTSAMSDPSKEAIEYFKQAGKTYQTILKRIDEEEGFAPEGARLIVEIKIAECLRRANQFKSAFEFLKKTIAANRTNVEVQREAALILQDWGRKEPKYYLTAIVGAAPDSKGNNFVWGWNGIIRRAGPTVDDSPRSKEVYYDAYLAKTRCRYLYARKLKDKAERDKQATDAELDLERLLQTRPDLGGPATFKKFDSAYKNFQKMRGEKKPVGLKERAKSVNDAKKNNDAKGKNAR